MIDRLRARGRAHGRLGHAVGQPRLQRRPAAARPRVRAPAPAPGAELRRGRCGRATSSAARTAGRTSAAGGWGSARRSTSPRPPPGAGGRSRRAQVLEMGVEGIKADDGEGYYIPPDARFADRRSGAEAAWAYGDLYRRTMQEVLDEVHPGTGVLFGRCGWSGPAGDRDHLGRRPGLGLLVAAHAGRRHPDRGRERLLELVARRRRLPRQAPGRALPARAAAALGAVRLLHAADAGPRALRAGGVALRRAHARHLSRVRAPPRAPRPLHPRRGGDRRALRAADHPPAVAHRSRPTSAAGGSPTPTASAPRSGSPRCSSRASTSAAPGSRAASGSTSGPATPIARRPRGDRRRRRGSGSRSGSAAARSSSPTRPSTSPPGSATRPSPSARSRRRSGASPRAGARRRGSPTAPRSAGGAARGRARGRRAEPRDQLSRARLNGGSSASAKTRAGEHHGARGDERGIGPVTRRPARRRARRRRRRRRSSRSRPS